MTQTPLTLILALAAYLTASVLYMANLFVRARWAAVAGTGVASIGVLLHTSGLVSLSLATGRGPYSTVYGAVAFMAWLVVLMQIGMVWRARLHALGAVSLPIAFFMMLFALVLPPETHRLSGLLQKQTMAAHISVTLLGYGAFTVAFGLAVIYLLENRLLKAKHLRGVFERLPPLRTTDELAFRFAAFGQVMMTLGIAIGAVYMARYPSLGPLRDPKVLPAMITWGIYTTYLLLRWVAGWRGRTSTYLLIAGYVAVLVTFIGINLIFPGMHGVPKPPVH